jgi:oligoendopeptidase F
MLIFSNSIAKRFETFTSKLKIEADLRGFESVIDYLLHSQEVTRDMFDRQIDMLQKSSSLQNACYLIREYVVKV